MSRHRDNDGKRLCLLRWVLVLLFVFGQVHVSLHAAEYGAHPHEHEGVSCDIQFLAEATKGLGAPTYAAMLVPSPAGLSIFERSDANPVGCFQGEKRHIRGPPALLS